MEEPTPNARAKTPRQASPKPPSASRLPNPARSARSQANAAQPKVTSSGEPKKAKKTVAATTTARRGTAARALPGQEQQPPAAKPATSKAAKAPQVDAPATPATTTAPEKLGIAPIIEQLEIALPEGAIRLDRPQAAHTAIPEPVKPKQNAAPRKDVGSAPERFARAAVRDLGPAARDFVTRTRDRYPSAAPAALARLATLAMVRDARRVATATSTGGTIGAVATSVVLARHQVRTVLTIAAAYGVDPTAEERVGEVLDLLRVPRLTEPTRATLGNLARVVAAVAVRRAAAKLVPFGGAVASAIHGGRSTSDVAARAMERYGRPSGPRR
jgi:hypothetical protein